MIEIEQNLQRVQERIADTAAHAGRNTSDISLVAVSKTQPVEAILAAYAVGIRQFGENRVEEASQKIPAIDAQASGITWHLIGHLQSRKAQDAATLFNFIHSVDSASLAKKLNDRAASIGKKIPILLEINISGEATKYGLTPEPRAALFETIRAILACANLETQGLMTVAPIVSNPEDVRPYFRALRELRDELQTQFPDHKWRHLSMGMTDDYAAAIAEGATIIRIGRAIFGERK